MRRTHAAGGYGEVIFTQKKAGKLAIANGSLWQDVKKWCAQGQLMASGTPGGNDTLLDDGGLTLGHAYGLLKAKEETDASGTHKLLQCRNPWGKSRGEWTGKWSDADTRSWTRRMRMRLNYEPEKDKDDGLFWIEWSDFVEHMTEIYVCRTFNVSREMARGRTVWHMAEEEAAFVPDRDGRFTKLSTAPQFSFAIDRPTNVAIQLNQSCMKAGDINGDTCVVFAIMGKGVGGKALDARANSYKGPYSVKYSSYSSKAFHRMNLLEHRLTPDMGGPGGAFTLAIGSQKKNGGKHKGASFALKLFTDRALSRPLKRLNVHPSEREIISRTLLGANVE